MGNLSSVVRTGLTVMELIINIRLIPYCWH